MAPYHHMLAHFPIALLGLSFLVILLRALTSSEPIRRLESSALVVLMAAGIAGGIAAFSTGVMIWPPEAVPTSTMGRNKILIAAWMLGLWSVILVVRWRAGEAIWEGAGRLLMLGLGAMAALLLATTGTLGGHLLGTPSALSAALRQLGWDVYHTYYAPDWVLYVMIAVGATAAVIGLFSGRRGAGRKV